MAVLLGLVLALLLGESIIRTFLPCPDYGGGIRPAFYSNLFQYDPVLGWEGVPNLATPYYSKDFRIVVSHDSAGYRNIFPSFVPGKRNYLLLGDSYAWGWGVNDDETAAAVFTRHHEKNANMYSLGVAGYGTDQQYLTLKKHLAENPHAEYRGVVLLFYFNDLEDVSAKERYGYPKPFFQQGVDGIELSNVPVPERSVPQNIPVTEIPRQEDWMKHSQLFNFATKSLMSLIFQIMDDKPEVDGSPSPNPVDEQQKAIPMSTALLQAIQDTCREHRMFFHVVLLMTNDTKGADRAAMLALEEQLLAAGLPHSQFNSRKFPNTDLWLDAHYNPYGQSLLADHIGEVIRQQELSAVNAYP